MALHDYFREAADRYADHVAVRHPVDDHSITYAGLDELSNRLSAKLVALGVRPGDRVGIYLDKSVDAVACILGILKCGAAYVPVDPNAPASRNGYILANCAVRAAIVDRRFESGLAEAFTENDFSTSVILPDRSAGGLDEALSGVDGSKVVHVRRGADDLAYILYTSGSTGRPKGVMISHGNAVSFVDWCTSVFEPTANDRFSSHAPFHFDLSILDVFVSLRSGATLVLVPSDTGKEPVGLAKLIAEERITVWYSAPSILGLMAQFGKLGEHDYSALRMVLFAGEVFPVGHLRSLVEQLPHPRYFNLYGPTETNVCTYHEIPRPVPVDRAEPYPIGKVCEHLDGIVVDTDGRVVGPGVEGELCIAGPSVLQGYWGLDEMTGRAFLTHESRPWYRTGDIVADEGGGIYKFLGRRDRMIKKRGYRVELGEIEACLYRHPEIQEAAVVAGRDADDAVIVHAHLATRDGKRLSLIAIKRFCSENLPLYMVPDVFHFHERLPKTSTDKVNYQELEAKV